ncbi:hypothetical protein OS188_00195 [Xanthomarina sp. F1114]|uniref:hypothetical protein n=1 Tax=Xanthomarina sp. F1114 TaxID=2996019 RepID=UPI00225DF4A2|nr:hypothetical protein [Xanthomarina sp. F1114]MCX7546364.1 hypothetical protein [Xanthomarina sp. F1114]
MIVNPQLFNYRLIIGTLVIAIVILGSYGFVKYQALKNHQSFVEQETSLVQNELHEMIKSYDTIRANSNTTDIELAKAKAKVSNVLDSVRFFSTDVSVISKYKNQIAVLEKERSRLYRKYNVTEKQNKSLEVELYSLTDQMFNQQKQLNLLKEENLILSKTIKKIQSVSAENVQAMALRTVSTRNDAKTNKIDKLNHIEVCLTLLSNEFTPKGNKNIFVQILGPDNQLVVERGHVNFKNQALNYSGMTVVNNSYDNIDVCTKINVESKELFEKGTYSILVYNDDLEIGKTEIDLK